MLCHMSHTVILTGGSSGMGLLTARLLAERGWTVVATGRDLSSLTAADRASGIVPVRLDLGSLVAVDAFVEELDGLDLPPIRGLICNAGMQSTERRLSEDGYEITMAVNVLSPVRLIDRLAPRLAPGSRVLWTSSGTHDPDEVRRLPPALEGATLDELLHAPAQPNRARADGFQRYATSKLCGVRIVPHLARALGPEVTINSFDPGLMPGTGLARDWAPAYQLLMRALTPLLLLTPRSHRASTSARHLADLLTSERFATMTGAYVVDDHPAGSSIASHDAAASERMYADALTAAGATTLGALR